MRRNLTRNALLASLALALSVAERWIPLGLLVPLPGIKLGLANIVTMFALNYLGFYDAAAILAVRVTLGSMLGGGFASFCLSMAGGVLSLIVMYALFNKPQSISLVGVSIAGAAAHNTGQIIASMVILSGTAPFWYLPVLLLSALVTGTLTGTLMLILTRRLDRYFITKAK